MPRPRTGSHVWRGNLLYARISYKDEVSGKQKSKERRVPSNKIIDLRKTIRELENELEERGQEIFDGQRITFKSAAEAYAQEHIKPAVILDGKKIEGLKRPSDAQRWLNTLIEHFGKKQIGKIDYQSIKAFKQKRLKMPTARGDQRKTASVHRELEILRAVLRFAQGRGWLFKNPFGAGSPLINKADETERMTILSADDEATLLSHCVPPHRAHLRSFVVIAIDTFMRKGELFALLKSDIDFVKGVVRVRSTTTKTERPREIGLTSRALAELRCLTEYIQPGDKVFTLGSVKRSWATACRLAGLKDLRIHDLRHTGITRRLKAVVRAALPWQIVMKESGHSQLKTFMRYFNPDDEMLAEAAKAMSELYAADRDRGQDDASESLNGHVFDSLNNSPHVN